MSKARKARQSNHGHNHAPAQSHGPSSVAHGADAPNPVEKRPVEVEESMTADGDFGDFEEWSGPEVHPGRRRKKKSFGLERQKLAYTPRPGFHRHWANDVPGRLQDLEERGYAFVKGDDGQPVSRTVGTREGGGGMTGFLMEIPEKWYQEDKAAMHAEIDGVEAAIRRGAPPGGVETGKGDFYEPEEHPIRMETSAGRYAEQD